MTPSHRIARIRIELDHTDPVLWRRVEVPLTACLKGLHDVIQAVMPFEDSHLFHFEFGDTRYGIPDPEWDHVRETLDAKGFTLDILRDRHQDRFTPPFDECGRAQWPAHPSSVKVVSCPGFEPAIRILS